MTLPVELETSVNQLRLKHAALVQAVNDYRSGTINASKQELLDMAAEITERLEVEEYTLLGQVARVGGITPAQLALLRGDMRGLFYGGEQGAWYDPSDMATLFQDAEGTIPVTASGDPVGLMLDKSQGLRRGLELVDANIGALGDTYVYRGTSTRLEGRVYRVETTSTSSQHGAAVASPDPIITPGKLYEITLIIHEANFKNSRHDITLAGSAGQNSSVGPAFISAREPGVYTSYYRPPAGLDTLTLRFLGGVATVGDYADIEVSVREVSGNHATQATSAARPIYQTDGTLHWLKADGVDDYLVHTAALTKASTVMAACERLPGGGENSQGLFTVTPANSQIKSNLCIKSQGSEAWGTFAGAWVNSGISLLGNRAIITLTASGGSVSGNLQTLYTNGVFSGQYTGGYAGDLYPRMHIFAETPAKQASALFFGGIAVDSVLSDDKRVAAERYLANKAGVTL